MSAVEDKSSFDDTPSGWAQRWQLELSTARKALEQFYVVAKAEDEAARDESPDEHGVTRRLCLYASNKQTIGAMRDARRA